MTKLAYNQSIKNLLIQIAELNLMEGPVELCCMWFDDLYFPGQKIPDGYSLEVWERGMSEWKSCFTDHELKVLAEFHEVFESENDRLSMEQPSQWRDDPHWKKVAKAAHIALTKLNLKSN